MVEVSYVAGGLYIGFIVISSLLVGILPPFVNRPYCKEDPNTKFNENTRSIKEIDSFDSRSELEFEKIPIKQTRYQENFYFKKYKVQQRSENFPDCPDILNPTSGRTYPWENPRLSKNVVPIHYDIELYVPNFDQLEFNGLATIYVEIVENSTDTFIIHHRNNKVEVFSLEDKNENEIEIICASDYTKNDYFVFKTATPVDPSASPLKITFYYEGEMNSFESGIFQTDLENPKT